MKTLETKIMYFILGACLGALIVTANPIVDQLPDWQIKVTE